MLPKDIITETEAQDFLPPRGEESTLTESLESGGIALNDPSEEFTYSWMGYVEGGEVLVKRVDDELTPATTLFSVSGEVTELSLTFDQNMRPTVAYVEDGVSKLYWYNTSEEKSITTVFNVKNPRVSLDDKRRFNIVNSDIIFAYINDSGVLAYRLQRERYSKEHVLALEPSDTPIKGLINIGMGQDRKFVFLTK